MLGMEDRIGEKPIERRGTAHLSANLKRCGPAGDPAGYGVGRKPTARRYGVKSSVTVKLDRYISASRPTSLNADWRSLRLYDEPEAIAADAVHMRIDDGDRCSGSHHRLDGISTLAQHANSGLRRQVVWRTDHAAECCGSMPVPSSRRTGPTLELAI